MTARAAAVASAHRARLVRAVVVVAATGLVVAAVAARAQTASRFAADEIERGRYLAVAADCVACHTEPASRGRPEGATFAGGYAIASPVGAIVSTNITPSVAHGIGAYGEADFARALREGVRKDGGRLYPAMPYTAYAKLGDADVHALYAYFMAGVAPVESDPPATRLPFPFDLRFSMAAWNLLFLDGRRFAPDPAHDAAWNRGAYLAEALEHCSACHTPRGWLMQEIGSKAYAGGSLGTWYAPNITSDATAGVGGWRRDELVAYFKTGRAAGKAQAAGGMAEAIGHSLQHLRDDDLRALASYVATIAPIRDAGAREPAASFGKPAHDDLRLRGVAWSDKGSDGRALYSGLCASCHGASGEGVRDRAYPALVGNTTVGAARPDNLVAVILEGVDRDAGGVHVLMPAFGTASFVQSLSDGQVAALATFVRTQFGPGGPAIVAADIATARAGGPTPLLVSLGRAAVPIAIVVVLVAVGAAFVWRRRRTTRRITA